MRIHRSIGLTLAAAATLLLGLNITGCSESESTSDLLSSATTAGLTVDGTDADGFPGLTLADLPADLELTDEQAGRMESALDKLAEARTEMRRNMGERQGDRQGGRKGGRGGGPGDGTCGEDQRGGRGRSGEQGPHQRMQNQGPPPFIDFLEEAADILDADQFSILAQFLVERRDEMQTQRDPRRGSQGGPDMAGRFLGRLLDLDEAQGEALRSLFQSYHEEFRTLREDVADGSIQIETAIESARDLFTQMKTDISGILTAEQMATLEEFQQERIDGMIERRLENLGSHQDRRVDFLGRVLELSGDQIAQVTQILQDTIPAREEILNQVKDGEIDMAVAALEFLGIERATKDQIAALLTPEQLDRLEILMELLPRGVRGGGFGGHGGGHRF